MSDFERLKNRLQMAKAMLLGNILNEEDLLRKQQAVDELEHEINDFEARKQALDKLVEYLRKQVLVQSCKVLASRIAGEKADWKLLEDFAERLLFARGEQRCFEDNDL